MSLDDLSDDIDATYAHLDDDIAVALDGQTKTELAMLTAALEPEDTDDLVRRAIHLLFESTVDTGSLDLHLRKGYDVTYDEYLSGMTFDEMTGGTVDYPQQDTDRTYTF